MQLVDILKNTGAEAPNKNVNIEGISADSRQIKKGFLFAALKGAACDGNAYIPQAVANGAAAVLTDDTSSAAKYPEVVFVKASNPHWALAKAAANFFGKQPENIAAVTGTNGKTSIADFVRQVLNMMGKKAASLGTLGLIKSNEEPQYAMTTPDPVTIHKDLKILADEGYQYLVMEASSHGLCQYRIGGVKVKVAGFTNLTRDHLDYHKTMENYLAAKKILFTDILVEGGSAVLNADIDVFEELKHACQATGKKIITYGKHGKELRLIEAKPLTVGQKLTIEYYGKQMEIEIPLAGEFQAMNVLCALGMLAELTQQPFEVIKYIMPILPMRLKMCCVRCVRTAKTICAFCLAAGATVTKANARRWDKLPTNWPTKYLLPMITLVLKNRKLLELRLWRLARTVSTFLTAEQPFDRPLRSWKPVMC